MKMAKLFNNGGSQAVRLPLEFRFDADEVYVRRDEQTGNVILSSQPSGTWAEFMAKRGALGSIPKDFLSDRQQGTEQRDPFKGWKE